MFATIVKLAVSVYFLLVFVLLVAPYPAQNVLIYLHWINYPFNLADTGPFGFRQGTTSASNQPYQQ